VKIAYKNIHVMMEQTKRLNTACNVAAAAVERRQWRALLGHMLN
jgi:hypothetical protein